MPNTTTGGTGVPNTVIAPGTSPTADLINGAAQDMADAQKAYDARDLGLYQTKINDATDKIRRLQQLLASTPTDATTTTTTSSSPSVSPAVTLPPA